MSGFEVVGLVLGVFPLVISALEQYRRVLKAAGLLSRFEAEYRKTLDDVKDELLFLHITLEDLLLPLTTIESFEEGDLETLLADPTSPGWRNEDVDNALQQRLGRTYSRFIEITASLHTLVSRLLLTLIKDKPELQARLRENPVSILNLVASQSNTKQTNDESRSNSKVNKLCAVALRNFLKKEWQYRKEQIHFGLTAHHRDEILKEIRRHNKNLERLLDRSDKIAKFKQPSTLSSSPKAVRSLLQYWQHADRIHALIRHSWGSLCQKNHCAHLWLQHRTSNTFEFKLLLLWAPKAFRRSDFSPWDRQGLSIKARTLAEQVGISKVNSHVNHSSISTAVNASPQNHKKRRVGFSGLFMAKPASIDHNTEPSAMTSGSDADQHSSPDEDTEEILRLCDTISACGMQATCIGSLSDHEADRQYSVFSQPEQKITCDEITLQEVLHASRKQGLRRSDRFRIALAIASSHLQLHSTQWARKQWEASDIRFPMDANKENQIMFDKPYVSADFNVALSDEGRVPKKTDRSFACLGIMLLELLFGACLEEHDLWQQLGQDNKAIPVFRLMVAKNWADDVEDEAGLEFSSAVMWCLNESPTTLEGNQWRRDLADRVVLPIQNCCEWIQMKPSV